MVAAASVIAAAARANCVVAAGAIVVERMLPAAARFDFAVKQIPVQQAAFAYPRETTQEHPMNEANRYRLPPYPSLCLVHVSLGSADAGVLPPRFQP